MAVYNGRWIELGLQCKKLARFPLRNSRGVLKMVSESTIAMRGENLVLPE